MSTKCQLCQNFMQHSETSWWHHQMMWTQLQKLNGKIIDSNMHTHILIPWLHIIWITNKLIYILLLSSRWVQRIIIKWAVEIKTRYMSWFYSSAASRSCWVVWSVLLRGLLTCLPGLVLLLPRWVCLMVLHWFLQHVLLKWGAKIADHRWYCTVDEMYCS